MVSHDDMLLEHNIYHQLVQIRVFKQFRLWKTFYVWRHTTKHDKYARTVSGLCCCCLCYGCGVVLRCVVLWCIVLCVVLS